ncbi:MAG: DNA polymerase I [Geitlerinemataceae cyanobacterium]
MSNPTFLLVDGHSLAFRAYYAFAKNRDGGLKTSTGVPTSICFGFLRSLLDTIEAQTPEAVAIAFDTSKPTFRHEADATYKGTRSETPEDFIPDIQNLERLLQAFGFTTVKAPGYEADDILGTLSKQAADSGYTAKILSGDRDLFQLVGGARSVLYLSNAYGRGRAGSASEFDRDRVVEKMGVPPEQVIDFKALCGDSSDNIPGVKGIGEKTAVKLLAQYPTLDEVYAAIDSGDPELKGAVRKKLEADREAAYHSQFLAKILEDVPLEVTIEDFKLTGFDEAQVAPLLTELELNSFLNTVTRLQEKFGGAAVATTSSKPVPTDDGDTWFFSAEDTDTAIADAPQAANIAPQIIDTPEKLAALVVLLENCTDPDRPVAWDTETTSLKPWDAELVGIGCCWGDAPEEVAYIPVGHSCPTTESNLDCQYALDALRPILESADYPKALQNAKYDRSIFRCQGVELRGVAFDTMLASYTLDPENTHNLTDLSLRYLDIAAESYKDLVPKGKTIADLPVADVARYCGTDAHTTFRLVAELKRELADRPDADRVFSELELPLEPVLADMEHVGISIDRDYLGNLSEQLGTQLATLEATAYDTAGEEFNLNSPKQLSELFFEKLGLDKRKSRKTKTGYSTNAAVLEKLQGDHPVVDSIVEFRTLAKLKSTYVDALPTLIQPQTDRVHTDFNQAVTATGRLSSSNPNLQNIPIRTEFSRQIRKAFLPRSGWQLVAADYSQIELRILAHLSQEPVLVEAYTTGQDVHALTAQLLTDKDDIKDITTEERRLGKIINFGVIYGMGAHRFAREAGVSTRAGKEFIERYNERYAKVFGYLQDTKKRAIANGYVETIFGRRRYMKFDSKRLREMRGSDIEAIDLSHLKKLTMYDSQLLRAAANAPIQGSSADIIKLAMVKLHQALAGYEARLLLQVHDELILEVPPEEIDEVVTLVRSTMESAVALSVPLVVEASAGANWMEAK